MPDRAHRLLAPLLALVLALLLAFAAADVHADAWQCDTDLEVQCYDGSCSARTEADGFIAIGLQFDSTGNFSMCAYSGCWKGKGSVASTKPFLIIWKAQVDWSDPNRRVEGREDVLIAFHRQDQLAVVKVGTIATPLHCSKEK